MSLSAAECAATFLSLRCPSLLLFLLACIGRRVGCSHAGPWSQWHAVSLSHSPWPFVEDRGHCSRVWKSLHLIHIGLSLFWNKNKLLSTYLLAVLQFQHGRQKPSFDVRHLRSVRCDVTFGFEITPGCSLWLKNVPLAGVVGAGVFNLNKVLLS